MFQVLYLIPRNLFLFSCLVFIKYYDFKSFSRLAKGVKALELKQESSKTQKSESVLLFLSFLALGA